MELLAVSDRLGLLDALAAAPPTGATAAELARATGNDEAAVRDLFRGLVAGRYVAVRGECYLASAQLLRVISAPAADFPYDLRAYLELTLTLPRYLASLADTDNVTEAERAAIRGISRRIAAPVLHAFLLDHWIAAVPGIVEAMSEGTSVLEVGCGDGYASRLIGDRFPNCQVLAIDTDAPSIREAAEHRGRPANVSYQQADLVTLANTFGAILLFHTLHELADPAGALSHIAGLLERSGTLVIVEATAAGDSVRDTADPLTTISWLSSYAYCVPASRALGGPAPGAMWGSSDILELLRGSSLRGASTYETLGNRTVFWAHRP